MLVDFDRDDLDRLYRGEVTVVTKDGNYEKVKLFALDLYEVAETICDEYPTARVIHVEDLESEKLNKETLDD